jgi:hypothetical protein
MAAPSRVVATTPSGRLIGLIAAGHFCSHFYMSVFGFVSTGLNIGGIIAPPRFGCLPDRGQSDPRGYREFPARYS